MSEQKRVCFMQGNEAVVEGAIAAGVRIFAGYPITPASEIAELMSRRLPQVGGTYIQFEDELASLGGVIGASLGGAKTMTATSGPGFSLMQENLGVAAATETPCVIVDVMRGGPASGMPTLPSQGDVMQARWGTHGDHGVVVLAPGNVRECFDFTVKAVNISEWLRCPVILLSDAAIGHSRERVELPDPSEVPQIRRKVTSKAPEDYKPFETGDDLIPEWADRGKGYRYHICSNNHGPDGFPADSNSDAALWLSTRIDNKMKKYQKDVTFTRFFGDEEPEILFITYGCESGAAKDAVAMLQEEGCTAGLLQLQTLWPFPEEEVRSAAAKAGCVIVPELNMGQVLREVERVTGLGRPHGLNRSDGRLITPGEMVQFAKGVR